MRNDFLRTHTELNNECIQYLPFQKQHIIHQTQYLGTLTIVKFWKIFFLLALLLLFNPTCQPCRRYAADAAIWSTAEISRAIRPSSWGILHPASYILHPTSCILHLASYICILHLSSYILHLASCIFHPTSCILHLASYILQLTVCNIYNYINILDCFKKKFSVHSRKTKILLGGE